jgi:predicted deacetylase
MAEKDQRRVIACLHDVTPRDFERIVEIDRFYEEIGIGPTYAMLVVPNFWGAWPLEKYPAFVDWLRERAQAGVEIFLHGFFHHDTTPRSQRSRSARLRHSILGEGEFAVIDEDAALERLRAGRKLLSDLLDLDVRSFVAPAWQYSRGARAALSALGFDLAENRAGVWSPASGRRLTATPVIAYSNRDSVRRNLSLEWSRRATRLLAPADIVRHAIHPGDFDDNALRDEIRRSLSELLAKREAVSYRSLISAPAFA